MVRGRPLQRAIRAADPPARAVPVLPLRHRSDSGEVYGFERIPIEPLAAFQLFLACAQGFGAAIVVLELLTLAAILAIRWRMAVTVLSAHPLLLALPLLAMFSALWSDLPAISLRYGAQLVITVLIGIVIARTVQPSRLALIVFAATGIATAIGVALGRVGPSPEGPVLIGLSGSKNQMGYTTLFLLVSALALVIDSRRALWLRALAGASLVPAMDLLIRGHVTTALVLALAAFAATGLLLLFALLPRQGRVLALGSAALLSLGALTALPQLAALGDQFRSETLGKDDRLTGRTLLWEAADQLIAQRPVLGHGYRAVWLGDAGTELLARFGLRDGRTFNFHNTVIELRVDLGLGGIAVLALTLLLAWGGLFTLLIDRVTPERIFAALVLLTLCARMFTELMIAPFLLDTVMLFAVLASVFHERSAGAAPKRLSLHPPRAHFIPSRKERITLQ